MASAFPATLPVRLDLEGRIDVDVSCPACGYNLRMQRIEKACPECGQAIDVVQRDDADRLDAAAPGWVAGVRRGVGLLHAGTWLAPLGVLPGLLVATAGVWCLTRREPGRPEGWAARGTRLSARWAPLAAAVCGVAFVAVLALGGEDWSASSLMRRDATWLDILLCTAGASLAVGLLEAWRVLFRIAARADGPDAARACRETWKRYLIAVAIVVGMAAATQVADLTGWRPAIRYRFALGGGAVLVLLAVLAWAWWSTLRLTGLLKSAVSPVTPGPRTGTQLSCSRR